MDNKLEAIIVALDKLTGRIENLENWLATLELSKKDEELFVIKDDLETLRTDIEDELDELQERLEFLESNL